MPCGALWFSNVLVRAASRAGLAGARVRGRAGSSPEGRGGGRKEGRKREGGESGAFVIDAGTFVLLAGSADRSDEVRLGSRSLGSALSTNSVASHLGKVMHVGVPFGRSFVCRCLVAGTFPGRPHRVSVGRRPPYLTSFRHQSTREFGHRGYTNLYICSCRYLVHVR